MTLLLTKAEVEGLLNLEQAMEVLSDVLREQAAGAVVAIPPRHVPVRNNGALRIVSGALLDSARMGVRVGPAVALASSRGTALLYDATTGDLLSVMAYPFGTLRTGASLGLATRLFARPDAEALALLGSGRNALSLLRAACSVRPIKRIRVFSRRAERREAFAERARSALNVPVEAVESTEAATGGAAIVFVATDSLEPVVQADQLSPGVFVATMGRPSELDGSIYRAADLIVVGHRKHEEEYFDTGQYRHQLLEQLRSGTISSESIHELSDVVAGTAPGRSTADQTIVYKESQGGFGDIGFANFVYAEARRKGLGTEMELH